MPAAGLGDMIRRPDRGSNEPLRSLRLRLRDVTVLSPAFVVGLLGCTFEAPETARAQQQCGPPDATGHVVCAPAVYPDGISYAAPTPFTLTLQQTTTAAVSVPNAGVQINTSGVATATLNRELTGTAGDVGPTLANADGPAVSVTNTAGAVSIDLRDPGNGAAGVTVRSLGSGVVATSSGDASVLLGAGSVTSLTGSGVQVSSSGAIVVDTGTAAINAAGNGVAIQQVGDSGAVTVNTGGPITGPSNSTGNVGILIGAGNTANTAPIQANVGGSLTNETGGVRITSLGSRSVTVSTGSSALIRASEDGINISTAGAGVITVTTGANITADTNSGTVGNAITLNSDAGAIKVMTASGTTLSTNLGPFDVVANSNSGDVDITSAAILAGVNATGLSATTETGSIAISSTGAIGALGQPIRQAIAADVAGGSGTLQLTSSSSVVVSGPFAIQATNAGAGASNLALPGGSVTAEAGDAVRFLGGAGSTTASVSAGVAVSGNTAIFETGSGALTLSNSGTLTGNTLGQGVRLTPTGTTTAVLDNAAGGLIQSAGDINSDAAVFLSGSGGLDLENAGVIKALALTDHTGVAFTTPTDGAVTINNLAGATIDGRVVSTGGAVNFVNTGSWFTNGGSIFGAAGTSTQRTLTNSGTLQAGATTGASPSQTSFTGLDSTRNSGVISLSNGVAGDNLSLTGSYVGSVPGQLLLDITTGKAGVTADTLDIAGTATGSTSVSLTAQGTLGFVPRTLLVQTATGSSPDAFTLSKASSSVGLVQYAIVYDASSGSYFLVSSPSAVAAEFAQFAEIRQTVWFETSQAVTTHLEQLRDQQGVSADLVNTGVYSWNEVVGGVHDRSLNQGATFDGVGVTYDQSYNQSYVGDQLGAEIVQQFFYSSATIGITGGYISSSAKFDSTQDNLNLDQLDIGAYAAYNSPVAFVNGLLKADFGRQTIDSGVDGFTRTLDTRQFGLVLMGGHRFQLGRWFIEPVASLGYVHGYVAGGGTTDLTSGDEQQNAFNLAGGSVTLADDNAARGHFVVRFGVDKVSWRSFQVRPYAEFSVDDDFLKGDKVAIEVGDTAVSFPNERPSTFGEARAGVTFWANGRCRLDARVDALFGDGVVGGGGNLTASIQW